MNDQPTDPPMEPKAGSTRWFESGPSPIINDPDLATLIVRIGMASNAISAQFHAASDARHRGTAAARMRDVLCSLVSSAALTTEAIKLASEGMTKLRPLAKHAGATHDLLVRIGKLCAGKHPSADVLNRARDQIGFHWDKAVIGPPTREYGKNKKIVWMESGVDRDVVHRLGSEVLAYALFPEATRQADPAALSEAMAQINDAMHLIVEFFTASAFGYMKSCDAVRKTTETPRRRDNRTKCRKKA